MSISQDPPQNFEAIAAIPSVSENGPIWQLMTAQNWPNLGGDLALTKRPGTLQKMGHFSSRVEFETISRQKCQFLQDPRNFEEILVYPFISKNGTIRWLIATRNSPDRGENLALARRPGALRKMGNFNSRLAFKMGPRQKMTHPQTSPILNYFLLNYEYSIFKTLNLFDI